MATQTATPTITLNNGVPIPQLGLGTWQMDDNEEAEQAVAGALEAGYRLIDTATLYRNEQYIGDALTGSGLARDEYFVTTKLWKDSHAYGDALQAFDDSRDRLGLDYLDLYLIHWPNGTSYREAWRALERLYDEKCVRAIGVSNFSPDQLKDLLARANVPPAVNQIELHPLKPQRDTRNFCQQHDIRIQSYSPLQRASGGVLDQPELQELADRYNKTPAQIILRWHIQHDFVVIPKSSNPGRQRQNIDIFDFHLTDTDMATIDNLA